MLKRLTGYILWDTYYWLCIDVEKENYGVCGEPSEAQIYNLKDALKARDIYKRLTNRYPHLYSINLERVL